MVDPIRESTLQVLKDYKKLGQGFGVFDSLYNKRVLIVDNYIGRLVNSTETFTDQAIVNLVCELQTANRNETRRHEHDTGHYPKEGRLDAALTKHLKHLKKQGLTPDESLLESLAKSKEPVTSKF